MRSSENDRLRFAADEMLGSLAKWLRIIGYDTSYERDKKDDDILKMARLEDRILLTRDRLLAQKAGNDGLYVIGDGIDDQIRQVRGRYGLNFDEINTRCATCNGQLVNISKEEALLHVPPRSLAMTDEFFRCSRCCKVFWKGTHWKNILEKLARLGIAQERSLE